MGNCNRQYILSNLIFNHFYLRYRGLNIGQNTTMAHTNRFYELKELSSLLEEVSKIVERMAFNEDLPIFDSELEKSLRISYNDFRNHISELDNKLF